MQRKPDYKNKIIYKILLDGIRQYFFAHNVRESGGMVSNIEHIVEGGVIYYETLGKYSTY